MRISVLILIAALAVPAFAQEPQFGAGAAPVKPNFFGLAPPLDPKAVAIGQQQFAKSSLRAIDYQTGDFRWTHTFPGPGGSISNLLTTAGNLLFSGDPSKNLIAFDPKNGKPLWHVKLQASVTNSPITYMLDGKQYVLATAVDHVYAFTLPD